jgi:hypothetical protein
LPLFERVRIEVYIPHLSSREYEELLRSFANEFTFAFWGCSTLKGLEGSYLSKSGELVPDQISLIYSDIPLTLSTDFEVASAYASEIRRAVMETLPEEEVLVAVAQIYHTV